MRCSHLFYVFSIATLSLQGSFLYAQSFIKGRLLDASSGAPLSSADVYLVSTTFGSSTDEAGNFSFKVSSKGKYRLIASSVGFGDYSRSILIEKDSVYNMNLRLSPISRELDDVVIQADTSNRKKDLRDFKNIFLGSTDNSSSCDILSTKDIYVYRDPSDKTLFAYAKKPIVVKNLALGYEVSCNLEKFESVNLKTSILGTVRFKELSPKNEKQKERWESARVRSYNGSLTHLMHCIQTNSLIEEGWDVVLEYPQLRPSHQVIASRISYHQTANNMDSVRFYRYVRNQPANSRMRSEPISGKELISDGNQINFEGRMLVTYKREVDLRSPPLRGASPKKQISIIKFLKKPITLYKNGYFEPQNSIFIEGYLGYSERISEFLPYEYLPAK